MNLIFWLLLLFSTSSFAQNQQLINWFVGADIVGLANSGEGIDSGFVIREFEISANSRIDHIWEGSLTLSMHQEPGSDEEAHPEIHEAFLFSNQLIDRGSLKLGRFFLGFGRLNRFHRHDWAISEAPLYHKEFFGDESVKDDGVEFSKLLSKSFYLNLTAGITSGNQFKDEHDHDEDEEDHGNAHVPTHYLRLASFKEFTTQKGLEYALNYVGRTDNEGNSFQYTGFDLTYKNKMAKYYDDLFQMEIWHRSTKEDDQSERYNDLGAYLYYEKGFNQNHSLGIKIDWYKPDHHTEDSAAEHVHGLEVHDSFTEVGLVYSYYNSEFMRTRLSLSQSQGLVIDEKETDNTKLMFQTIFMIGAHPAHLY